MIVRGRRGTGEAVSECRSSRVLKLDGQELGVARIAGKGQRSLQRSLEARS